MNCNNNKELRIVRGNAFSIKIHVEAVRLDGTKVEDFDLSQSSAIHRPRFDNLRQNNQRSP